MKKCKHDINGKCDIIDFKVCMPDCWKQVQESFHLWLVETQGKDLFV